MDTSVRQEITHWSEIRRADLRITLPSVSGILAFPIAALHGERSSNLGRAGHIPSHAPSYAEPWSRHFLRKFVNKEITSDYPSFLKGWTRNKREMLLTALHRKGLFCSPRTVDSEITTILCLRAASQAGWRANFWGSLFVIMQEHFTLPSAWSTFLNLKANSNSLNIKEKEKS